MTVTVRSIVIDYLNTHGYDGLFSLDGGCGCLLADMAPCMGDDAVMECEPGYLGKCDRESGDCCEACYEGAWHIQREKPDAKAETGS